MRIFNSNAMEKVAESLTDYNLCTYCGSKYPVGGFHSCSSFPSFPSPSDPLCNYTQGGTSPVYIGPGAFVDGETKRLLERIAVALEKLAGVQP